jgi:biopolymer transport protein ExbD
MEIASEVLPMAAGEGAVLELSPATEGVVSAPWWPSTLAVIFFAGVAFVLLRVLVSILSILRIIRQSECVSEEDGCRILVTERDIDPFSWMRYIVLSRKDWESAHESILTHEKAHIGYGHSLELLLVDILSALQWFNPAIWMLRADLQELHEYEADDAVLRSGANIREYQYLLIRKAVSKSGYSVANSFNHSILKNRITMMSKSKSPLVRGLRVLFLLPLVCLGLGLQARTVYVPVDKDSEKIPAEEKFEYVLPKVTVVKYAPSTVKAEDVIHVNKVEDIHLTAGKNFDTAPVCSENFAHWLNGRMVYPADCLYDGTLVAMFVVGEDGKVSGVEIVNSLCEQLDKMVAAVIERSPVWTPAKKNGKPVTTVLFQPVTFMISVPGKAMEAPVSLTINADGKVEPGGKVYTAAQLKDIIKPHEAGQPQTTVQIIAADDVPMGAINDVKDELRKLGSLKIRYSSPAGPEGTTRYMPPFPTSKKANNSVYPEELLPGVDRENIFVVRINSADKIFFGKQPLQDDNEMLRAGADFLKGRGKNARFYFQADRGTSYGAYRHMQELLMRVYAEVRNENALEQYGKPFSDLTVEEKNQINYQLPISISEAESKK